MTRSAPTFAPRAKSPISLGAWVLSLALTALLPRAAQAVEPVVTGFSVNEFDVSGQRVMFTAIDSEFCTLRGQVYLYNPSYYPSPLIYGLDSAVGPCEVWSPPIVATGYSAYVGTRSGIIYCHNRSYANIEVIPGSGSGLINLAKNQGGIFYSTDSAIFRYDRDGVFQGSLPYADIDPRSFRVRRGLDSQIYFSADGDIFRTDVTGGFAPAESTIFNTSAFDVDESGLYWAAGGLLQVSDPFGDGLDAQLLYIAPTGWTIIDVRVPSYNYSNTTEQGDGHVYWIEENGAQRRIKRKPITGGSDQLIANSNGATNLRVISPLYRDDTGASGYVYWKTDSGVIVRERTDTTVTLPDLSWHNNWVEVVQTLQNTDNTVELIEGRFTTVRAYPRSDNAGSRFVRALLHGTRDGSPLPGSPLRSEVFEKRLDAGAVPNRLERESSFNFYLPQDWCNGTITLRAEINPGGGVPESSTANNNAFETVTFNPAQPLCLKMQKVFQHGPLYTTLDPGFGPIINRAKWLLPTPQILIKPLGGTFGEVECCFPEGAWELPDDDGWMLIRMTAAELFDGTPDYCRAVNALNQRVGMIHTSTDWGSTLGLAHRPGLASLVKFDPSRPSTQYDAPFGGMILAHELAHNYDNRHVGCTGTEANVDTGYPYPGCQAANDTGPGQTVGWDMRSRRVVDLVSDAASYMSYSDPAWATEYHWNGQLAGALAPGGFLLSDSPGSSEGEIVPSWLGGEAMEPAPAGEKIAMLSGLYDRLADVINDPSLIVVDRSDVSAENLDRMWDQQMRRLGPGAELFEFRIEEAGGASDSLVFATIDTCCATPATPSPFVAILPTSLTPSRFVLLDDGGNELGAKDVTGTPPQVTSINSPAAGATTGPDITVSWTAIDADDDDLHYTVLYSPDDGTTWTTVAYDYLETSITLSNDMGIVGSDSFAGDGSSRFKVIASDDCSSSSLVGPGFKVPNRNPAVSITLPVDGEFFRENQQIAFESFAFDPEDGTVSEGNLIWDIGPGIAFLFGPEPVLPEGLPRGVHDVVLRGFDSFQGEGTDTITIVVGEAEEPDPAPLDTDGDGWPDLVDNCPTDFNGQQIDTDKDGVGDACDNCPGTFNPQQTDNDSDGIGDLCDPCPSGPVVAIGADGSVEPSYGPPIAIQNTQTSAGDNDDSDFVTANGSELDIMHAFIACDNLYLFIGGNYEIGQATLELFFDTVPGGQQQLANNGGVLGQFEDPQGGLKFDTGFEADYWLGAVPFNLEFGDEIVTAYQEIPTGGQGAFWDTGVARINTDGKPDSPAVGAPDIRATLINFNTGGVAAGTGADDGSGVEWGFELCIPLSALGDPECGFKIVAMLNDLNRTTMSNQILPGIGGGGPLGAPAFIDFNSIPGTQWAEIDRVITTPPLASVSQGQQGDRFEASFGLFRPDASSIRWRRDGQYLVDDNRIQGSMTSSLSIEPVDSNLDAGAYDAELTTPCGVFFTEPINLQEENDCIADINTKNVNPGEPGYGSPDGEVDGADLSYFVEQWLNQNEAVADINTKNVNPGEPGYGSPDGEVDGADLSFYVENWLAGCP